MSFPVAQLRVYNPKDFFGSVDFEGAHVTWDLFSLFGSPGSTFSGLCPDPSGDYLIQYPQNIPLDAGTAQWTPGSANAAPYAQGKDVTTQKLFLRCAPTTASPAFDTTLNYMRPADEGFFCQLYRAATTTGTLYLHLCGGRDSGTPGLRLAIEAGSPIRLQLSLDDDATWTDVDTASLGESEGYLTCTGRYLTVDVLSECDPDWTSSADSPFPPPGQVCVTLNGTAVLTYALSSLPAGALRITGSTGAWALLSYAQKLFTVSVAAGLPNQIRAEAFQGTPDTFVSGYQPYPDMAAITVTVANGAAGTGENVMQVLAGSQASAALAITTPADGQETVNGTVYAKRTCFLSALEANWPSVQTAPNPDAAYTAYEPIYALCEPFFDQGSRMVRRRAVCIFQAQDNSYAPGSVIPAARAAVLLMGDVNDPALTPVLTGWTAIAALNGQEWQWVDWQKHFAVIIEDRHRKGDEDQAACLHMEPFDYQAHYLPVRKCHYKLGVTDDWMTGFPDVDRAGQLAGGGTFEGYYLGGGTAQEPLWQPAPDEAVNNFLLKVLEVSGEEEILPDGSQQIQPMVLGDSPDGHVVYTPLPAGVASAFVKPGQTLSELGLASVRSFVLNDFLKGTLRTSATLSHIRSPIVIEGLGLSGNVLVGVAANEALGGGTSADPTVPGSVATNVPYVNISRRNSSPEVVARAVAVAAVTMGFPSIGAQGTLGYLDPGLDVLSVITITDPYTMGSAGAVPFWTNSLRHLVDGTNPEHRLGETSFSARLLGQAG
ncbi:MAG: hypothetical protein ACRYFS_11700 [Janthinobacterium lividum]